MTIRTLSNLCISILSLTLISVARAGTAYDCLIEPTQTIDIGSPVTGLLDKVHVHRGDKVTKGQIIATLESKAELATTALAHFKSEMVAPAKTAESKIEFSKRKFERRRDMQAQNFMSGQERDEAEGEMKLAEAELKLAQENKQMARLEWQQQSSLLNLRTIRSPFDGVVVNQFLYPGEIVEPGGQKKAILKLAQLDPLRVNVLLPMAALGKIKPDMSADVVLEAPIGGHYAGRVKIIDKVVDAASGTFGVFLEISNPKLEVPAGVKCRAEFPSGVDMPKDSKPAKRGANS
ncbi:MAG: RND family efflux transporter MFP subunit [Burkholderiaceae bacterium]|jgi:RND family efflux transporter MFP subunit